MTNLGNFQFACDYRSPVSRISIFARQQFEIFVIWLRAGPTRTENFSGPGLLDTKILWAINKFDVKWHPN